MPSLPGLFVFQHKLCTEALSTVTLSPRFCRSFKDTGDKGDCRVCLLQRGLKSEGTAQGRRVPQLGGRLERSKRVTLMLPVSFVRLLDS